MTDRVISGTNERHSLEFLLDLGGFFEATGQYSSFSPPGTSAFNCPSLSYASYARKANLMVLPYGQLSTRSRDDDTPPTHELGPCRQNKASYAVEHVVDNTLAFR